MPAPGIADAFWLALYPCVLVAFAALARTVGAPRAAQARARRRHGHVRHRRGRDRRRAPGGAGQRGRSDRRRADRQLRLSGRRLHPPDGRRHRRRGRRVARRTGRGACSPPRSLSLAIADFLWATQAATGHVGDRDELERDLSAVQLARRRRRLPRARAALDQARRGPHSRRRAGGGGRRPGPAGRQRVGRRARPLSVVLAGLRAARRDPPLRARAGQERARVARRRAANASWSTRSAHALAAGELDLHYQPLVDAATGAVEGAEALLRWSRDGVNVPPDQFLPTVERSELMAPADRLRARPGAGRGRDAGTGSASPSTSRTANLSEPDLPARVIAALRRHDVPPARADARDHRDRRDRGQRDGRGTCSPSSTAPASALSVDDFGTGHSSLVRLARFPICEVKIDRSFVSDMHTAKRPIVATTIELAHALGLRVVAEGIEDRGTLRRPARARMRPRAGLPRLAPSPLHRSSRDGCIENAIPQVGSRCRLRRGGAERERQRLAVGAAAEGLRRGDVLAERQRSRRRW